MWGWARLSSVSGHELGFRQDVTLHGVLKIRLGGARLEPQCGIQGIQLEEVAVGGARGRARPTVAEPAEVVPTVASATIKFGLLGDIFR